ncbi:helix-turn-helix domain-containing protein [Paenibacillus sp. LMG 31460]|uniref:Helix-turn-helix domain-containing protein n=1 Tax=Paenibacillus germinis TaxID=2654979 RepID=A0ABX1Z426_9BACL|nr:AraC family transcriptional regulator [Paenibacillus germinis]NOU87099.1 helix-turn-helix domain-containing protein [Paenibacillus germinis]
MFIGKGIPCCHYARNVVSLLVAIADTERGRSTMPFFFKAKSFRMTLFWQFFTKYFLLIVVPAIVATIFINVFVVRLIENEAEKSSLGIMRNYARQMDAHLQSLQASMIQLLGSPNMKSLLKDIGKQPPTPEQIELFYATMEEMNTIRTEPIVSGAFLYFANADLVIDHHIHTSKSYYFRNQFSLEPPDAERLWSQFTGKKMMHFTDPYYAYMTDYGARASFTSVVMGFPFNSDMPGVFLSVQIEKEKLQRLIQTQESWISRMAILDADRSVVSQSDEEKLDKEQWLKVLHSGSEGALAKYDRRQAASFVRSEFDSSWYYVSWVDLQKLMQPARMLRMLSIAFLCFFLLLGVFVSYYLSRRLYNPISEIRNRLQSHPPHRLSEHAVPQDNDFDIIQRFTKLLMNEHKELSQLVKGILPVVQEDFVSRILLGEYRDDLSIAYYSKEIAFTCELEGARAVLVVEYQYYDSVLEQLSETSKSFLLAEVKEMIGKQAQGTIWLCQTRADILACVVHWDHDQQGELAEVAAQIKSVLEPYAIYFKATIGLGKIVQTMGELNISYQYGLALLKQKSLNAQVEVFSDEDSWDDREPLDSFLSAEEVNRIGNVYRAGDYPRLLQSAREFLETGKRKQANATQMKSLFSDVLNTWIRAVETDRNDLEISMYSGLFDSLNRSQTWDEMEQCLERIHAMLFLSLPLMSRSDQFEDVVRYIREHYDEDLSIERFTEQMNMSVSHFSRTFKEVVGEKYVEFITSVRLSAAKQLLRETDMKIEEIAERVGYLGSNAFIRSFRKYEGITPGKYRSIK